MNIAVLENFITNLFPTKDLDSFKTQSGFNCYGADDVKRIGYCTNLTNDTAQKAIEQNVNLLITHHDAWDFMYGLKETCIKKLSTANISHYYNHLPLDDCDFGTNDSLLKELGFSASQRTHEYEGFYCGRVVDLDTPIEFSTLVQKLEKVQDFPVKSWEFHNHPIKRIGLVCGGGSATDDVKEAIEHDCDVYITSEHSLYTIQYSQFKNINLIVGSHTFMELPGIKSLAEKVRAQFPSIEIIHIPEEHLE